LPEPDDLCLLTEAAQSAGEIALRHFRKAPEQWEKPHGAGPVTAADLEVDAMLRNRLTEARPGTGWLSEETPDSADRLECGEVFIVDPIDGTRAFIAGETAWAISLALTRAGRVTTAVVFLPAAGLFYSATAEGPALLNGQPIRASSASAPEGATVLSAKRFLSPDLWPGGVPPLVRHFRPSLAWRLALVAEGRFDAMLTLGDAWEWDVAGGALIAERAGAIVTGRDGRPARFNNAHPVTRGMIAAPPALHAALIDRLLPEGRAEPAGTV
jgi:myo-inositol-1(or 4)-monophosphatase